MLDFGYYMYRNEHYFDRVQILEKMMENKDYSSIFTYHFHDDFFSKLDWKTEPEFDIQTLYKLRAQQLRDKYDYLVVQFSGGSDSTQLLRTFLDNNIFVDEIQSFHFEEIIEKLPEKEIMNNGDSSVLLEYEYAAKPFLQKYKERSPNTKISSIDLSKRFTQDLLDKRYDYLGVNKNQTIMASTVYNTTPKAYTYYSIKYVEEQFKQRNNVAIIRGFDKPRLRISEDDRLFFNFNDLIMNGNRNMIIGDMPKVGNVENFYWSKDAPLIPIKQSHMILKFFRNISKFKELFLNFKYKVGNHDRKILGAYFTKEHFLIERMFNPIIYPNWNKNVYAGAKEQKMTSDFILLDKIGIKHHGQSVVEERRNFMLNKYDKIENKHLLHAKLSSPSYYIGKVK